MAICIKDEDLTCPDCGARLTVLTLIVQGTHMLVCNVCKKRVDPCRLTHSREAEQD